MLNIAGRVQAKIPTIGLSAPKTFFTVNLVCARFANARVIGNCR